MLDDLENLSIEKGKMFCAYLPRGDLMSCAFKLLEISKLYRLYFCILYLYIYIKKRLRMHAKLLFSFSRRPRWNVK